MTNFHKRKFIIKQYVSDFSFSYKGGLLSGSPIPRKKIPIPKSRKNSRDFVKIPGRKIRNLQKIPIPKSRKIPEILWQFRGQKSGIYKKSRIPGIKLPRLNYSRIRGIPKNRESMGWKFLEFKNSKYQGFRKITNPGDWPKILK